MIIYVRVKDFSVWVVCFICNEIKKIAWNILQNFDHALILREDDPILPMILKVYEEEGIKALVVEVDGGKLEVEVYRADYEGDDEVDYDTLGSDFFHG